MAHFKKHILPCIFPKDILCNTRPLGLPVKPQSPIAITETVSSDDGINGRMKFHSRNLSPLELTPNIDIMNIVIFNGGKCASHTSNNTSLPAIIYMIVPNDMTADQIFGPTALQIRKNCFRISLCAPFYRVCRPGIVKSIFSFSNADTTALRMTDCTVLNNPPLTPMRSQCAWLKSSWRCPIRSHLANPQTRYLNIINTFPVGKESEGSHIDFHKMTIRIGIPKIAPDFGIFFQDLRIPAQPLFCRNRLRKRAYRWLFIHRPAIQIHFSCVMRLPKIIIPISAKDMRKGIIFSKKGVIQYFFPQSTFHRFPSCHFFCPADHWLFPRLCDITDPLMFV